MLHIVEGIDKLAEIVAHFRFDVICSFFEFQIFFLNNHFEAQHGRE